MINIHSPKKRQSLFTGLDHWTGLLDWNTGLTFDAYKRLHLAPYSVSRHISACTYYRHRPCQSSAPSLRHILRDYTDIAEAFTDLKLSMAIAHQGK